VRVICSQEIRVPILDVGLADSVAKVAVRLAYRRDYSKRADRRRKPTWAMKPRGDDGHPSSPFNVSRRPMEVGLNVYIASHMIARRAR